MGIAGSIVAVDAAGEGEAGGFAALVAARERRSRRLLRPLRQLAHQLNVALVVNHHQNKGQEFRGSTAIRAAFDQEWAFHRADAADEAIRGVLSVEGRFGAKQKLRIRLGEGLGWVVEAGEARGHGGRGVALRERIPFYLADRPEGATAQEIAAGLESSQRTVWNVLGQMLGESPPTLVATGEGTKNDPRRFRLPPTTAATIGDQGQATLPRWWQPGGDE